MQLLGGLAVCSIGLLGLFHIWFVNVVEMPIKFDIGFNGGKGGSSGRGRGGLVG
jgi:hypothetical protein